MKLSSKDVQNPSISVIIASYNSQNTIDECLSSVRTQNYPQKKIEIIIADGGSQDKTLQMIKKFDTTLINVPKHLQNAEYNKGVGVRKAKGDLLLMIDHDNVLPHKNWLNEMVAPLVDDKEIVASETLRYHYDPSFSLLDRYFALFGAGDPIPFYLGKADRLSYLYDTYNLLGNAEDKGKYYRVQFDKNHIPTLGANGFLVRRSTLQQHAKVKDDEFFHIDVNVDLIGKGFNTYAFVKNDIIHHTGYKKLSMFLYRRILFMEQFYVSPSTKRRYSVYTSKDTFRLIMYVVYSVTIVKPLFDAARGYMKIRDVAWFFHPVLAYMLTVIYGWITVKHWLLPNKKK